LSTKFDFKPKESSKITLFANKAEAIVFWLSVAGLIFLAIISTFRYLNNRTIEFDEAFREDLLMRLEAVEAQNDSLRKELQNLSALLKDNI